MKIPGSADDPLWYKDAIIYELHVKAFFDDNNDGVGDFPGLLKKLDYLQDLGVTCIWLLPFYPSPLKDDGYDIADYSTVHPSYGTLEDARAFIRAAHERGLQVLTELVVNHTSDEHEWFQRARSSPPGSPERDFYVWSDSDEKYKDVRIIFLDTEKSNWTWDPVAKAYYWHRFFSHQPDLNLENPAVLKEVINTMRFWLDAIPYLVEREGTNCENLDETHAIIKEIRRQVDLSYANRALLAEANQWPSDVRAYFGDGDECNMAYHFPLMPRMFMGIHLEDRHPITEIMAQTPDIPDNSQWALFLRNHDELTLEMVTDEERDYMYLAYSADPRARLNLGIRRRLAPLMGNDRRRIELLNSLLFSFPGTPIIYYGDEIGMGDNIYLGDRNGVRTPMQWSPDRNGGFSRANPARLYSPVIMDPIYGYEAINVEAQEANASSLLNWMKNMIALRKLFRVFGRGSMEFLNPANRKVLPYIRRYDGDLVLCVANLSRFPQPVELDLAEFAGYTPVEMLGYTEFPPITERPYMLTLGPYSFYWFELQRTTTPITVRTVPEAAAALVELPEVLVDGTLSTLFEGRSREELETHVLPQYLPRQRWFGGKARSISRVKVTDWALLQEPPVPAFLAMARVDYSDGGQENYSLFLAVASGAAAEAVSEAAPQLMLARLEGDDGVGLLHEAVLQEPACEALLAAIAENRRLPAKNGAVEAARSTLFEDLRGPSEVPLRVVRSLAEQSNTSMLYGDRLILKLIRRLQPGVNPDFEISRYLTEEAGFRNTPRLAGAMRYEAGDGPRFDLALLQEFVPNQGDGWQNAVDELGRYFENCLGMDADPNETDGRPLLELSEGEIPPLARDAIGLYLERAANLGRRTAELHLALGRETDEPAFRPEPLTPGDLAALSQSLQDHASKTLDQLREKLTSVPEEILDKAGLLLSRRPKLLNRLGLLAAAGMDSTKIRVHGDYHLGQVLAVENDFMIIDFEGEPARSLEERRAKQSPMKDVAGMLRSFSYAAFAGLFGVTSRRPGDFETLEPWARLWERWTSAAFLSAYRATAGEAHFLPADRGQFETLLAVFLLDKALYELRYELNNRPSWLRIPLWGVLSLIEK